MNLDFNLNLTQQQKLIMNQQMQLSVKLLQMSNFQLVEYLNQEIQENPVIDADFSKLEIGEDFEKIDYKKLSEHSASDNYSSSSSYGEEKVSPFNFISEKKSLKDYLKEQLVESNENTIIKTICMYIIEGIDSVGYFTDDLEDTAKFLKVDRSDVDSALKIVQSFEPNGIGAKNLKECLIIQAEEQGLLDDNFQEIILNHLEDIGDNRYNKIAKELNISVKEAQEYGDEIKKFEPKPSRGFYTGDEVKFIIPDAYIENIGEDIYIIMNDTSIPSLSINNVYKDILDAAEDQSAKKYLKEKMNSAIFLMKSINMRRSTMYKVLEKIVDIQKEYFLKGNIYLKAMTLKDISEKIDMHESTVSRAIKEKYIYTNMGIVRIKDLFTTSITNDNSEDVSVNKIKNEIKGLIEQEDNEKPLSDQNIADILKGKDFKISRRTVAKYREEMEIKASSKRKRF
ncbi:RNA polymerase factor sigma-54 [Clostridium akagii]|uniref:RNA polymerase factor sigma-54 n=1 Tax=Clostridium akagii TaxID=91623 RepID=UPI00047B5654|nr:RNA polymerase factor sigma-54 [Clostridium akagii]